MTSDGVAPAGTAPSGARLRGGAACGAIDLGGTKMEARLFDAGLATLATRRAPTPGGAEALLDAVAAQVGWLLAEAGDRGLPVGIGVPGVVDPDTGAALVANLPARGLGAGLSARFGRPMAMANDAVAFAVSEARGGAAEGAEVALGLVMGTGLGAGLSLGGRPAPRHAGLSVEIGHVGMPAAALDRHGLPLWRCGCGRMGCAEAYVSGPGLGRLALWRTGEARGPEALAAHDPQGVLEVWADLMGEVLRTLHLTLDPGCVVLGGGLSNLPDAAGRLAAALERHRLGPARLPAIRPARFGPTSGARGMALLALDAAC